MLFSKIKERTLYSSINSGVLVSKVAIVWFTLTTCAYVCYGTFLLHTFLELLIFFIYFLPNTASFVFFSFGSLPSL